MLETNSNGIDAVKEDPFLNHRNIGDDSEKAMTTLHCGYCKVPLTGKKFGGHWVRCPGCGKTLTIRKKGDITT